MRFSRIHVLVIGLIVIAALAVAFVTAYVRPQLKELSDTRQQVEQQRAVADTMLSQLEALSAAQTDFELKEKQTYAYMTRMPEISTNRYEGMIDLWREYAGNAGPKMVQYINANPGIFATAFSLPPAPITPLDPIPIILVPVENFAVRAGNLPVIIDFLRAISKAPRMATIASVSIRGTSPYLTVSLPLTTYLVTRWALPGPGETVAITAPAAPVRRGPPPEEEEEED